MEFEGYKYNDCGVCLNPTFFAEYDNDKVSYKLSYSKIDKGYVTGIAVMAYDHGTFSSCSIYNKSFDNEKDAKMYGINYIIKFLSEEEDKMYINQAIKTAKEFKMSIMYKQLELF